MNSLFKRIFIHITIIAAVYILCGVYLIMNINKRIFYPRSDYKAMPGRTSEFFLKTNDGETLCGWLISCMGTSECVVLYNHGNTGNMSDFLDDYAFFSESLKADVYAYDYRGYGKSSGSPDYQKFYADCDAAVNYVTEKIKGTGKKIIIYGRSLGGAAAIYQAANYKVDAVITESTFASIKDHVWLSPAFVFYPLAPDALPGKNIAHKITAPWFMAHAELDRTINIRNMEILNESAKCDRTPYIIKNAGHNRNGENVKIDEYGKAIQLFINNKVKK